MLRMMCAFGTVALLATSATAQTARPAKPGGAPGAATARVAKPADCQPTAGIVAYRGGEIAPRKLGDLPPASEIYAVYNEVDGCPTPVVVREGIGANPAQKQPVLRTPPKASNAR